MKALFRQIAIFSLLIFFAFAASSTAQADVIRSFHSEIRLQKDSSFQVREIIKIDFNESPRHGIYRFVPIRYNRNGGRYTIYLNLQSVLQDGNRAKYDARNQGDNFNVKIGDPDSTIEGEHTYEIHYTVRRALNFFDGAPELYWNVTGNQWPYPIENASARIYPPPGVSVSQIKTAAYFGPPGSTAPAAIQKEPKSILFYAQNIQASNELTIVAGFPAGAVAKPSALQQFFWFFADWWALFAFPLLTFGAMMWLYMQQGRDVEGNLPAQVEWYPPKDLTPAEVGTLIDESCDMADIISTLVDLAARGYLHIEEIKTDNFLFFKNADYVFTRSNQQVDGFDHQLALHEKQFLRGVFGEENALGKRVTLSSLKNHFYVNLEPMKTQIYSSLTTKGLFLTNPETERQKFIGIGVALLVIGGFLLIFLGPLLNNIAYGIGLLLAGVIVVAFSKSMPAKTALGSRKLRECQGFQRFVKLAEKDRIEKLITDDPTIFGRLLPYAMVLGVADEWANKFSDLMKEPPDWYTPYGGWHGGFYSGMFVNNLGSGMNSMGSTFSSKPQSQAGGGGSGFSSGGGFSGGGFGGGGGGSW